MTREEILKQLKKDPWWMKIKLSDSYGPKGPIMKSWVHPVALIISVTFWTVVYIIRT